MAENYEYSKLSGTFSFRILELLPSESYEAKLCCYLTAVSHANSQDYEALSYAWDAQIPECPIYCGDRHFLITKNCDAALRRLRRKHKRRLLWVDSICINQNDVWERNLQVKRMSSIYHCARQVVVWLGESDEFSDMAFEFIKQLAWYNSCFWLPFFVRQTMSQRTIERARKEDEKRTKVRDPYGKLQFLSNFLDRSWFKRLWTIQEAALAQKGAVYCGKKTLPWEDIYQAVAWTRKNDRYTDPGALVHLYSHTEPYHFVKNQHPKVGSDITELLFRSYNKQCSDPKDKVYGLVGIIQKLGSWAPIVDYELPMEQIYRQAVELVIKNDEHLVALLYVGPQQPIGQPSWVSFGYDQVYYGGYLYFGRACWFDTEELFSRCDQNMTIKGKAIDKVKFVTELSPVSHSTFAISSEPTPEDVLRFLIAISRQIWPLVRAVASLGTPNWIEDTLSDVIFHVVVRAVPSEINHLRTVCKALALDAVRMDWDELMPDGAFKVLTTTTTTTETEQMVRHILGDTTLSISQIARLLTYIAVRLGDFMIVVTENGRVGSFRITTPPMVGDIVAHIYGLKCPLILRKDGECYHRIGPAFIYGIMLRNRGEPESRVSIEDCFEVWKDKVSMEDFPLI